jgi:hypothetical protein
MERGSSLPYSQEPATCPDPEPDWSIVAYVVPKDQSGFETSMCDL